MKFLDRERRRSVGSKHLAIKREVDLDQVGAARHRHDSRPDQTRMIRQADWATKARPKHVDDIGAHLIERRWVLARALEKPNWQGQLAQCCDTAFHVLVCAHPG